MVATIGKGTVARYYLRRTEYYLTGKEPAGVWLSSSAALGISVGQTVEADLFEKLHAGLGPDGKPLSSQSDSKKQRLSGYDLTLSAPKSVSILFALADDATRAAIGRVQLEAAQAVIDIMNQEAAFTRRGHNGLIIEKASLIVAAFQHGEARPAAHSDGPVFADMDLHTHLCIVNIVENSEVKRGDTSDSRKRYSAVDGRAIYNHKMLAGAVYALALSSGLQKLGFEVAVTGTNGIFEIVNAEGKLSIDPDTKRYFSARRSKIEERLAEYDLVTGEAQPLAAAVGKATRLADHEAGVRMRQVKSEKVDLALYATDDADGFTKIGLSMPWRMHQRHEHLLRPLSPTRHVVLHNRDAACEAVLVPKPLEDSLRRMPLLLRSRLVVPKNAVDQCNKWIKLRLRRRLLAHITRRHREPYHFGNRSRIKPKPSGRRPLAQALDLNRIANPSI